MEPEAGVDGRPPGAPESLPPDEAEVLIRAASPRRLVAATVVGLTVLAALAAAGQIVWAHRKSALARNAPVVHVPAGTLRMGADDRSLDERPAHAVALPAFRLDLHEVTAGAYRACVDEGGCTPAVRLGGCNYGKPEREDHPINCVEWSQARAYCAWAGGHLPTEEEWEYAARGGDGRRFPWGDEPPDPSRLNACDGDCRAAGVPPAGGEGQPGTMIAGSDGFAGTAPVGSYPAGESPFGARDLAGNVAEWTDSAFCLYPASPMAAGPCSDQRRVLRGGSFATPSTRGVESSARASDLPTRWSDTRGFRCAR